MARELTNDEVRERFLKHVAAIVEWWDKETKVTNTREKLEGVALSILALIDGSNIDLPKFVLAPDPHPDDKAYRQRHDEDWFPGCPEVKTDISDCELHSRYCQLTKPRMT
jgi:hypothetical protein